MYATVHFIMLATMLILIILILSYIKKVFFRIIVVVTTLGILNLVQCPDKKGRFFSYHI